MTRKQHTLLAFHCHEAFTICCSSEPYSNVLPRMLSTLCNMKFTNPVHATTSGLFHVHSLSKPLHFTSAEKCISLSSQDKYYSTWFTIQDLIGPASSWPKKIHILFWTKNIRHFQRALTTAFTYCNGLAVIVLWSGLISLVYVEMSPLQIKSGHSTWHLNTESTTICMHSLYTPKHMRALMGHLTSLKKCK